jgi:hypothetical protein
MKIDQEKSRPRIQLHEYTNFAQNSCIRVTEFVDGYQPYHFNKEIDYAHRNCERPREIRLNRCI